MSSPEELLYSRGWRLRHGAWMLWGILSFGLLWCVGFAIIGFRAKNRTWLIFSAVWFAFLVVFLAFPSSGDIPAEGESVSLADGLISLGFILSWLGGTVLAFFVNRRWLLWLAHNSRRGPWYATDQSVPASSGSLSPSPAVAVDNALRIGDGDADPAPSMESGSAHSSVPRAAAPPSGPALVDLNTADRERLTSLPGIDLPWADHIIEVRQRIGRFGSPLDLVTVADVPPHVFAGMRNQIFTSDSQVSKSDFSSDGRRLEF